MAAGGPSYHRLHSDRSEAIQTASAETDWIASSLTLLAMTLMDWAVLPYPSTFAGFNSTDSPQPQAETWFGLLKTNCADILSTL